MLSIYIKNLKAKIHNGKNGKLNPEKTSNPLLDKLNEVIEEFVQKSKQTSKIIRDNGKDKKNPNYFEI